MNDFTKRKLINNLIELVSHFYEKKHSNASAVEIKYLKGFCEGIAHTLVETKIIDSQEAKRILKGLGKKRSLTPVEVDKGDEIKERPKPSQNPLEDLDVPTIFRKEVDKKRL